MVVFQKVLFAAMRSGAVADILSVAVVCMTAWLLWRKESGEESSSMSDGVTRTQGDGYIPNPSGVTVGYRNNNPLNIEYSSTVWKGEIRPTGHTRFAQFVSMAYGYRAAFRNIRTYISRGWSTVADIIGHWDSAAASSYTSFVCSKTGFSAGTVIHADNESQMVSLVSAMSWMENGMRPDSAVVKEGYYLYKTV